MRVMRSMLSRPLAQTHDTLASLLHCCGHPKVISEGRRVHQVVLENGSEHDTHLSNLLVQMYGLCESLEDAKAVFDGIVHKDKFSWMFIISAFTKKGQGKVALHLFNQMKLAQEFSIDKHIFTSLLSACAGMVDMAQGMYVHECIVKDEVEEDIFIGTALIHMYAKCAHLVEAEHSFGNVATHTTLSWTVLINAYVQYGRSEDAFRAFIQMQQCGEIMDQVTITSLLGAFTTLESAGIAKQIHSCIVGSNEPLEKNVAIGNALITMYGKLHIVEDAWETFLRIPKKDTISWTAMIGIFAQNGHNDDAIDVFQRMFLEGMQANRVTYVNVLSACAFPNLQRKAKFLHSCIMGCTYLKSDVMIGNNLINMYTKAFNRLTDACHVFEKMPVRDEVSWTTMISAYVQHGLGSLGIQLFHKMYSTGIEPNTITFVTILSVCAHQSFLIGGKLIHHYITSNWLHVDNAIQDALIHFYGRCRSLDEAQFLFNKMSKRNACTWSILISAYAYSGFGEETIHLSRMMRDECQKPDEITFLSILSACSHAGLVDEGQYVFALMREDYGINPSVEHYHCMIDLYGRVGRLEEAKNMIHDMPHEPTPVAWLTLLGACKALMDVEHAEYAANCVFKLEPQNPKPYIVLSNIYAAIGRELDAEVITSRMKEKCPALLY